MATAASDLRVANLMTMDPVVIGVDAQVDDEDSPIGLVSALDLLRALLTDPEPQP